MVSLLRTPWKIASAICFEEKYRRNNSLPAHLRLPRLPTIAQSTNILLCGSGSAKTTEFRRKRQCGDQNLAESSECRPTAVHAPCLRRRSRTSDNRFPEHSTEWDDLSLVRALRPGARYSARPGPHWTTSPRTGSDSHGKNTNMLQVRRHTAGF